MLGPRWQASGQPAPGPTVTDHREGIGLPSDPIQASRVRACARWGKVCVREQPSPRPGPISMTIARGRVPSRAGARPGFARDAARLCRLGSSLS